MEQKITLPTIQSLERQLRNNGIYGSVQTKFEGGKIASCRVELVLLKLAVLVMKSNIFNASSDNVTLTDLKGVSSTLSMDIFYPFYGRKTNI